MDNLTARTLSVIVRLSANADETVTGCECRDRLRGLARACDYAAHEGLDWNQVLKLTLTNLEFWLDRTDGRLEKATED